MSLPPIFASLQPLEKTGRFTPLGIRFWDVARNLTVTDGLEVTARPPERPDLARGVFQTLSGIYAFKNLPGLHDIENLDPLTPAGTDPPVSSPPANRRFIIEVYDRLERFIPVSFKVDLPYRGIFPTKSFSSPAQPALPGFFLFSAPSRPVLSDLGIVRAQLVQHTISGQTLSAAYAVLELQPASGPAWYGIADSNGSIVVVFPYPTFSAAVGPVSPPPGPPETRLQAWDVTIRVFYQPAQQVKPDSVASLPDLGAILTQSPAKFRLTQSGPSQGQIANRIVYGQPLVLQTTGLSELLIEL